MRDFGIGMKEKAGGCCLACISISAEIKLDILNGKKRNTNALLTFAAQASACLQYSEGSEFNGTIAQVLLHKIAT